MIAVVGAGVVGAAIADSLAARGASVTVFDTRAPGAGASQASAGVLCPYVEAKPGSPLLTMGARSLALWDAFAAGVRDRAAGLDFEYERTGTLEVAFTEDQARHLQDFAAWLRSEGVRCDWLTGQALFDCEPALGPSTLAGLLIPHHGFVEVPALVRALMAAARLRGAQLETPREVVHVMPRSGAVEVTVDGRTRTFEHVVIAAGAWSKRVRVAGLAPLPVRPIRGQLLRLRPASEMNFRRSVWGPDCYTVPWRDGRLLVGATVEDVGFDERATAEGVRGLLEAINTLMPASRAAAFEEVRVGLRPATADHLPLLGPLRDAPRIILATGHYRNGILLAPLTADVVTRCILDDVTDEVFTVTDPQRF